MYKQQIIQTFPAFVLEQALIQVIQLLCKVFQLSHVSFCSPVQNAAHQSQLLTISSGNLSAHTPFHEATKWIP